MFKYYNISTEQLFLNEGQVRWAHPSISFPNREWTSADLEPYDIVILDYSQDDDSPLLPYEEYVDTKPIFNTDKWIYQRTKQEIVFDEDPVNLARYVEQEKALLLKQVAALRYQREISPATVLINGSEISIPATRETQTSLNNVHTVLKQGWIDSTVWKISDDMWVVVDLATIEAIAIAVVAHVQEAFAWEKARFQEITQISTIEDLKTYVNANLTFHPRYHNVVS